MMKSDNTTIEWLTISSTGKALPLPMLPGRLYAGFPSPAEDYQGDQLDLNEYLIQHKEATFFARAIGHSMVKAGIDSGDLIVIDRAVDPKHNDIVVACIDGEYTLKRFFHQGGRVRLVAESDEFSAIELQEGQELLIFGVVRHVIKSF